MIFEEGFPETHWRSSGGLESVSVEFVISFYLKERIFT